MPEHFSERFPLQDEIFHHDCMDEVLSCCELNSQDDLENHPHLTFDLLFDYYLTWHLLVMRSVNILSLEQYAFLHSYFHCMDSATFAVYYGIKNMSDWPSVLNCSAA